MCTLLNSDTAGDLG